MERKTVIRDPIDALVIQEQLWVTTIEARGSESLASEFSITKAIPQTLAYRLVTPEQAAPSFGVVMNSSELLLRIANDCF